MNKKLLYIIFYSFIIFSFLNYNVLGTDIDYKTGTPYTIGCTIHSSYSITNLNDGGLSTSTADTVFTDTPHCIENGYFQINFTNTSTINKVFMYQFGDGSGSARDYNVTVSIDANPVYEYYHNGSGNQDFNISITPRTGDYIRYTFHDFGDPTHSVWVQEAGAYGIIYVLSNTSNFSINVTSDWDGSNINNVTALINGVNYTNTTGNVVRTNLTNNNTLYNYTISSPNWFSKTYLNVNATNDTTATLNQSIINVSVNKSLSGTQVCNFSINYTGTIVLNTSICSGLIYPNAGNYNFTIVDNTGVEDYSSDNTSVSVSSLDNKSVTLTVFGHNLIINATNIINNSAINIFTINISAINFTNLRNYSTTNGIITIPVVDGSYNITIDANGYALSNNSIIFVVNNSLVNYSITFNLTPSKSVNFTFYHEEDDSIANDINISFTLVTNGFSNNYTTPNGSYFIQDLNIGEYEIKYSSDGYDDRSYFFTITNRSTETLRLYISNSSLTTNYLIRVADENDQDVSNATVRLQKRFTTQNGSFLTIEECRTDTNGECDMFIAESSSIDYRFIVLVNNEIVKTTVPDNIVAIAGVTTKSITIRINLGSDLFNSFDENVALFSNMTYDNDTTTVTYTFIDGDNSIVNGCLIIERRSIGDVNSSQVFKSCTSGSSGTINKNVSSFIQNNTVLIMSGVVNFVGKQIELERIEIENFVLLSNQDVNDNLLLSNLLFIGVGLGVSLIPSIIVQIIISFLVLIGASFIGINSLTIGLIITFMVGGIVINYKRSKETGRVD